MRPGACAALGVAATTALALIGNGGRSHALPYLWPWVPPLSGARIDAPVSQAIARAALIALAAAWLGIGRELRRRALTDRWLLVVAGLWSLPLLVTAPMFSSDVYAYVASGVMQVHGFNPYDVGPHVLGTHSPVLLTVAPTWRGTPTPYGPGFLLLTRGIATLSGSHTVVDLMLLRACAVAGLAGAAVAVRRLARSHGCSAGPALWLVVLNPLVLTSTCSAAHNDELVIALVLTAFALRAAGRTSAALLVTVGAAEIKAFALLATAAIVTDHIMRDAPRPRWHRAGHDLALVSGSLVGATSVLGLPLGSGALGGWGWLSALDIPGRAITSLTPVDALWELLRSPLHAHLHGPAWRQDLLQDLRLDALALAGVVVVGALWRERRCPPERTATLLLVVALACGSALWPWYLLWLLPLVAVVGGVRGRGALVVASVVAPLTLAPNGSVLWGAPRHWPGQPVADVLTLVLVAALVWSVLSDRGGRWPGGPALRRGTARLREVWGVTDGRETVTR